MRWTGSASKSDRRISHGARGTTWVIGNLPLVTKRSIDLLLTPLHFAAAERLKMSASARARFCPAIE